MEIVKGKWKRNLFLEAWERCRSLSLSSLKSPRGAITCDSLTNSKSWHCTTNTKSNEEDNNNNNRRKKKCQVAPVGCFSVYVGPEKQRFVVKAKLANHPLFKMLLEDAESEYGYNSEGPILLPCDVDLFYKVLAEMEHSGDEISPPIFSSLILCSPSRRPISSNNKKGYGAYRLLSPSRMLKLNQF